MNEVKIGERYRRRDGRVTDPLERMVICGHAYAIDPQTQMLFDQGEALPAFALDPELPHITDLMEHVA